MPVARRYTDEEAAWIAETAPSVTNSRVMAEAYEARFGRRIPPVTLRTYCRKHGIAAGWSGTRDRSPVHRTKSGKWRVGGRAMTDAQHDWWLAHGEMPPKGTNVLRATDGMRLATDAELCELNRYGLEWTNSESLDACIAVARLRMRMNDAIRRDKALADERAREYARKYGVGRRARRRMERGGRS